MHVQEVVVMFILLLSGAVRINNNTKKTVHFGCFY